MAILHLSEVQRRELLAHGALAINARGDEILHGLDPEESQFLVDCGQAAPGDRARDARCMALAVKHEKARLRIAQADDEAARDGVPTHVSVRY